MALGPAEWGESAACGTVLDVTGPKGTVRVTVSDQCPECEPGHLDLAGPAFARIADPVAGIVPITYRRVVDPPTAGGGAGAGQGRLLAVLAGVAADRHRQPARVGHASPATPLQRTGYGYWVADKGAGPGPYQVRLTDDRGHSATATVPLQRRRHGQHRGPALLAAHRDRRVQDAVVAAVERAVRAERGRRRTGAGQDAVDADQRDAGGRRSVSGPHDAPPPQEMSCASRRPRDSAAFSGSRSVTLKSPISTTRRPAATCASTNDLMYAISASRGRESHFSGERRGR